MSTRFEKLIEGLREDEFLDTAHKIESVLKNQLQDQGKNHGLLRQLKSLSDPQRKSDLADLLTDFIARDREDFSNLDEELNEFCNKSWDINKQHYAPLGFNYIDAVHSIFKEPNEYLTGLNPWEECRVALEFIINEEKDNRVARNRLHSIIGNLVHHSLNQGNRSLAGEAGENMSRALLGSAGHVDGITYRSQFKTEEGSDTDFVLPFVEDGKIHDVRVFIACQFSSNDRARMASSELGQGAGRYLITGNGMDASTKKLSDIGKEIIQDFKSQNTKIVCRATEIKSELDRLEKMRVTPQKNTTKSLTKEEIKNRIEYMKDYTLSMSDFATFLQGELTT